MIPHAAYRTRSEAERFRSKRNGTVLFGGADLPEADINDPAAAIDLYVHKKKPSKKSRLLAVRSRLTTLFQDWLTICKIQPRLYWNRDQWSAVYGPEIGLPNTLGHIATAMMRHLLVHDSNEIVCTGCGEIYHSDKAARYGRNNFCEECRN